MPPGSSPSRVHRFFKHVKKVFKPGDQPPTSRTASPPPLVQPTTRSRELVPVPSLEPPGQSQQPGVLSQPEQIVTEQAPAPPPSGTVGDLSANAESTLALAAKKAGAEAWSGLKVALRLLEKGSDVFPPLKSAVGGFLGVVDIFEVCHLALHAST